MTTTRGSAVKHAVISATDFGNLSEKDENTIYFVGNSSCMNLYKGSTKIAGDKDTVSNVPGFAVLGSNPSNTTGMSEGTLYLAPNGKLYYKSGNTLAIAFDLVQSNELTESNNTMMVPSVSAMYSAIATKIAAAMTGTYRSSILTPVADVTALKAISTKQDKDVVFVESLNALFSYDAQSSATADDASVVQPTSGGGRWLKTQAGFTYSSTDFQWGFSGLELKNAVPLVVSALPTASANTVDRLYVSKADNKMYLGVQVAGSGGATDNVVLTFPNAPDDLVDFEGGEWVYVSGTGDSRQWTKADHVGAADLKLLYTNGAWKISCDPQGYMTATAASGSNPWDSGLMWMYNGTALGSNNYVSNPNAAVSYDFVAIAGASSDGASSTLINTVSSNPTVSASNNGETYFNTATGRTYVVSSGALVQKTYSKDDVDEITSWYELS